MEMRRFDRVHGPVKDREIPHVSVEFEIPEPVHAVVTDISLKGIGLEMRGLTAEQVDFLKKEEEFFVKINVEKTFFVAGVRNIWHTVNHEHDRFVYKGGMLISIIAPQDNIALSSFIEKMRGHQQG